ncbi:hypothetical protein CEXT_125841 [Caerostris extrusa]|uniref:Uncharacterized protein n=1 Tax=Caerostris extrusa TaxID=172846 RepID=A0AAV4QSX2_CAEEX|nr:hypothetical protein CEXT_125841 [Caerostris extrusa]
MVLPKPPEYGDPKATVYRNIIQNFSSRRTISSRSMRLCSDIPCTSSGINSDGLVSETLLAIFEKQYQPKTNIDAAISFCSGAFTKSVTMFSVVTVTTARK